MKGQSTPVRIAVATSTPNEHIRSIADRFGLPVYVNEGESGIAGDWTYALSVADTPLVTIIHQDDLYLEDYASSVIEAASKAKDPIIIFTDYAEKRGDADVKTNKLLKIKRFLLWPLKIKGFHGSRWVRRRVLSMGSPICCPSVTYVKARLPEKLFDSSYKVSLDWNAWEILSRQKGSFVYIPKIRMLHRIHENSETTHQIENSGRTTEDLRMFRKFWPGFIAGIIEHFYRSSETSNKMV